MVTLPPWKDFERDMKVAMLLIADGLLNVLGHGERAVQAAETFLGIRFPDNFSGFIIYEATESYSSGDPEEFLATISLEGTNLLRCVERTRSLLLDLKPIHEVSVDDERDDALYWIDYFVSAIPTDSYGTGDDYSSIVYDPERPLPALRDCGHAYTSLLEFVRELTSAPQHWDQEPDYMLDAVFFSGQDLARLADVDIRTVRNAMGPKGGKPIRSFRPLPSDESESGAYADPIDAIEWLSGRRGFACGRLDAGWINGRIEMICSRKALGAVPGLMFWLNGRTSTHMAEELEWDPARIREWTRGMINIEDAQHVAAAAGLDPELYARRAKELLNPRQEA